MIRLSNVSKKRKPIRLTSHPDHPRSLQDIASERDSYLFENLDVEFQRGRVSAILGASGTGKSTWLNCILGLDRPDTGTIEYETNALNETARITGVLQSPALFQHLTVLENLTLGPRVVLRKEPKKIETKAHDLLQEFELLDKAKAYPYQLSGGEAQRANIARALAMEPDILLLDEPTTAMNRKLVLDLVSLLRTLADQGMTILVSTHDLGFAQQVADALFLLEEGRLEPLNTVPTVGFYPTQEAS